MAVPNPTPIIRFIHVDNLHIYLTRQRMHAPNHTPSNGLVYKTIHNVSVQSVRRVTAIPCGPGGCVHDYVPFYFGYLSPMMLMLKTGQVRGYSEGQDPLIYLVSSAQRIEKSGTPFVFSDGHGVATFTKWFDDLNDLNKVDWDVVYQRYWTDNLQNPDRQRRKQAEFLVHVQCDWSHVVKIVVINDTMRSTVQGILAGFPTNLHREVEVSRDWYYW